MKRLFLALVAVSIAGCSEQVAPPVQQGFLTDALNFVHYQPDAAAAAETHASFWAVKGQERSVALRYTDTGSELLRFTVGPNALRKRPDGTTFENGDSILISVDRDDAGAVIFHFTPSGLKFENSDPAQLWISKARTNTGFLPLSLGVFKRESTLLPWLPVPSVQLGNAVNADIKSFTDFGMAVN